MVGVATILVCMLFATKTVTVKLLPFDNKSELDVVLDLPEGASLEDTERKLFAVAELAGTDARGRVDAGLCRHGGAVQFQRPRAPLLHRANRRSWANCRSISRPKASAAARAMPSRSICGKSWPALALPPGRVIKVVEVPPGPPVLATLLAEIYGPDAATRRAEAEEVKKIFKSMPYIVDVDDSYGHPRPRLRISIDEDRLEFFGVEQSDVYDTISMLLGGVPVGYSHRGAETHADRHRDRPAEERSRLDRAARLDARAGQCAARQQSRRRIGRGRP